MPGLRTVRTSSILRTPSNPTQPKRAPHPSPSPSASASTSTTIPQSPIQEALRRIAPAVDAIKGRAPVLRDQAKEHWKKAGAGTKWAAAGALVFLGGMYFLSGDDGSSDPVLGRPNPADRAYLSRIPTSKLVSGWM